MNKKLTIEQEAVLKGSTEAPWSSPLNNEKNPGVYSCISCSSPLFEGKDKYDSGSGWPSFDKAIPKAVKYNADYSMMGIHRVEVSCANCDGHLGHVFQDGPKETTGERNCINGCVLNFKKDE